MTPVFIDLRGHRLWYRLRIRLWYRLGERVWACFGDRLWVRLGFRYKGLSQ